MSGTNRQQRDVPYYSTGNLDIAVSTTQLLAKRGLTADNLRQLFSTDSNGYGIVMQPDEDTPNLANKVQDGAVVDIRSVTVPAAITAQMWQHTKWQAKNFESVSQEQVQYALPMSSFFVTGNVVKNFALITSLTVKTYTTMIETLHHVKDIFECGRSDADTPLIWQLANIACNVSDFYDASDTDRVVISTSQMSQQSNGIDDPIPTGVVVYTLPKTQAVSLLLAGLKAVEIDAEDAQLPLSIATVAELTVALRDSDKRQQLAQYIETHMSPFIVSARTEFINEQNQRQTLNILPQLANMLKLDPETPITDSDAELYEVDKLARSVLNMQNLPKVNSDEFLKFVIPAIPGQLMPSAINDQQIPYPHMSPESTASDWMSAMGVAARCCDLLQAETMSDTEIARYFVFCAEPQIKYWKSLGQAALLVTAPTSEMAISTSKMFGSKPLSRTDYNKLIKTAEIKPTPVKLSEGFAVALFMVASTLDKMCLGGAYQSDLCVQNASTTPENDKQQLIGGPQISQCETMTPDMRTQALKAGVTNLFGDCEDFSRLISVLVAGMLTEHKEPQTQQEMIASCVSCVGTRKCRCSATDTSSDIMSCAAEVLERRFHDALLQTLQSLNFMPSLTTVKGQQVSDADKDVPIGAHMLNQFVVMGDAYLLTKRADRAMARKQVFVEPVTLTNSWMDERTWPRLAVDFPHVVGQLLFARQLLTTDRVLAAPTAVEGTGSTKCAEAVTLRGDYNSYIQTGVAATAQATKASKIRSSGMIESMQRVYNSRYATPVEKDQPPVLAAWQSNLKTSGDARELEKMEAAHKAGIFPPEETHGFNSKFIECSTVNAFTYMSVDNLSAAPTWCQGISRDPTKLFTGYKFVTVDTSNNDLYTGWSYMHAADPKMLEQTMRIAMMPDHPMSQETLQSYMQLQISRNAISKQKDNSTLPKTVFEKTMQSLLNEGTLKPITKDMKLTSDYSQLWWAATGRAQCDFRTAEATGLTAYDAQILSKLSSRPIYADHTSIDYQHIRVRGPVFVRLWIPKAVVQNATILQQCLDEMTAYAVETKEKRNALGVTEQFLNSNNKINISKPSLIHSKNLTALATNNRANCLKFIQSTQRATRVSLQKPINASSEYTTSPVTYAPGEAVATVVNEIRNFLTPSTTQQEEQRPDTPKVQNAVQSTVTETSTVACEPQSPCMPAVSETVEEEPCTATEATSFEPEPEVEAEINPPQTRGHRTEVGERAMISGQDHICSAELLKIVESVDELYATSSRATIADISAMCNISEIEIEAIAEASVLQFETSSGRTLTQELFVTDGTFVEFTTGADNILSQGTGRIYTEH